jgi:hypothetical protein
VRDFSERIRSARLGPCGLPDARRNHETTCTSRCATRCAAHTGTSPDVVETPAGDIAALA